MLPPNFPGQAQRLLALSLTQFLSLSKGRRALAGSAVCLAVLSAEAFAKAEALKAKAGYTARSSWRTPAGAHQARGPEHLVRGRARKGKDGPENHPPAGGILRPFGRIVVL